MRMMGVLLDRRPESGGAPSHPAPRQGREENSPRSGGKPYSNREEVRHGGIESHLYRSGRRSRERAMEIVTTRT
jgi:hypothetical protein